MFAVTKHTRLYWSNSSLQKPVIDFINSNTRFFWKKIKSSEIERSIGCDCPYFFVWVRFGSIAELDWVRLCSIEFDWNLVRLGSICYTGVLVSYSECQRSACVTSAGQSAVYLKSAKKNIIVTVFHSVKVARLGVFWIFHKWGQMNNYGESSIVTWRCKTLGYILWKLGALNANCAQTERLRLKTV